MPPTSDQSGPHVVLSSKTVTKLTAREVVAAVAVVISIAGAWWSLKARVDAQGDELRRHMADPSVHMSPNFQISHGAPVGTFDFHETLNAITLEIDELKKRPFVLDGDTCRQVKGGTLCQQK